VGEVVEAPEAVEPQIHRAAGRVGPAPASRGVGRGGIAVEGRGGGHLRIIIRDKVSILGVGVGGSIRPMAKNHSVAGGVWFCAAATPECCDTGVAAEYEWVPSHLQAPRRIGGATDELDQHRGGAGVQEDDLVLLADGTGGGVSENLHFSCLSLQRF